MKLNKVHVPEIPSDDAINARVDEIVKDKDVAKCIKGRLKKSTVECKNNNQAPCNDGQILGTGEAGGFWGQGGDGITFIKGNHVTVCIERMQDLGLIIDVIIHEFAHNCGLPPESGLGGGWPDSTGKRANTVAPGIWGRSGVPGTCDGGKI